MMLITVFLISLLITSANCKGGEKGTLSDEWLLKTQLDGISAKSVVTGNGFKIKRQLFPGYYVLERSDASLARGNDAKVNLYILSRSPNVEYVKQLKYLNRTTKAAPAHRRMARSINITDSFWPAMWHLGAEQFPSMNVSEAWTRGYTGLGVHVTVLDDGVEPTHTDLIPNYEDVYSYDYLYESSYVNHTEDDFHGTWCAGIIAAAKNEECVLGIAYESKFSSVKIFDAYFGLNAIDEALALTHALPNTDVYSNSWGPWDTGDIFEGPTDIVQDALLQGVTEGRDGKGAIYTWAAGNGGVFDDCNCDGYASSIYTISVTAIGHDQAPAWYSEECSSILVGTYSGDSPDLTIATTDTLGGCTTSFQGTSASCPIAAGVIALGLEANPDLTWRDIQHLIVETSVTQGLILANWQTNGAGKQVSHSFGFGLINAIGMIDSALNWTMVPEQVTCQSETIISNSVSSNGAYITSTHTDGACSIAYLEHVEVWVSFTAAYRGAVQISLISPFGTKSKLLRQREYDYSANATEWTFMTVHSWGENPSGDWTLQLETLDSSNVFGLSSWKLTFYGTETIPVLDGAEAQVNIEETSNDNDTWFIVAGAVGGAVLFVAVAAAVYCFVKKPKDPRVHPAGSNGPVNSSYQ